MISKKEFLEQVNAEGVDTMWSPGYSEPGYRNPKNGIFLANWNNFPDIDDLKESTLRNWGYVLEWSDEWDMCDNCYRIFRSIADGYGWKRAGAYTDDTILCHKCIRQDPDDYLEWLENNPRHALSFDLGLKSRGYIHYDNPEDKYLHRFESGLHPGMDDDPQKMARQLRAAGITRFLFTIDSTGQFDVDFSLWIHKSQWKLLPKIDPHGFDPGKAAEAALRGSIQEMNSGS